MVSITSTLILASALLGSLTGAAPIAAVDSLAGRHYEEYKSNGPSGPNKYGNTPAPSYADTGYSSGQSTSFSSSNWHEEMLRQVNAVRAENGRPPLKIDERLNDMAQRHSNYQNSVRQMTHDDSAGSLGDRCSQSGIDWNGVAENVAQDYPDVTAVMNGWVKSPGHFKNLIGDYNIVGFGYDNGYSTQEFALA